MSRRHTIIFILGLLLFTPSLWSGFALDDYYYLKSLRGHFPEHNTDRSLFTFFINDWEATTELARQGNYPWWIDEGVKGETFRPLSDLLLRFDYALFGMSAPGYHFHSILWWAATLLACGLLFRRVLPGAFGLLAFLLFAISNTHVMPVSWIANRNALVAVAPMLFGLWAWIRWREDGWRIGRVLAPLCIVIGMAGSELGLSVLAYFVAYELVGKPSTAFRSRLTGLAPIAALGAAYGFVYWLLGYRGSGSGVYHHPLHDPFGFLQSAATGIPTLIASGIAGFTADFWFAQPSLRPAQVIVGCVAAIGLLVILRTCWQRIDASVQRGLRWLLTGSVLAMIPVAAVFPSDRMIFSPGIGLTAAVAVMLVLAYRSWKTHRRWWLITTGAFLAIVHLILAPLMAVAIQEQLIKGGRQVIEIATAPAVREAGGKEAILLFAPDYVVSIYLPVIIDYVDGPPPRSWRPLSIAPHDHWLRRTGPRSLELEVAEGGVMLRSIFEELFRSPDNRLPLDTIIDRGLIQAEIKAANDRGPTRVAFNFDRDLSDRSLCFLVWEDSELRRAELPAIGEAIFLKRSLGPGGF